MQRAFDCNPLKCRGAFMLLMPLKNVKRMLGKDWIMAAAIPAPPQNRSLAGWGDFSSAGGARVLKESCLSGFFPTDISAKARFFRFFARTHSRILGAGAQTGRPAGGGVRRLFRNVRKRIAAHYSQKNPAETLSAGFWARAMPGASGFARGSHAVVELAYVSALFGLLEGHRGPGMLI